MKFGNDPIFDMADFDETSRWMEWSKNEFSHSLSPEPTAVGACSSAIAVDIINHETHEKAEILWLVNSSGTGI